MKLATRDPTVLGVTGPKVIQPNDPRMLAVAEFVTSGDFTELHHGDCIGWDAYAHEIALKAGLHIFIHPPTNHKYRAFTTGPVNQVTHLRARPYLLRNKDIAKDSYKLLAISDTPYEVLRSGEWATIRYGMANGMSEENGRLVILTP